MSERNGNNLSRIVRNGKSVTGPGGGCSLAAVPAARTGAGRTVFEAPAVGPTANTTNVLTPAAMPSAAQRQFPEYFM
jgi:hypothetical protein